MMMEDKDEEEEDETSDSENREISATEIQQYGFRFEYTELYRLIARCSRASLNHAWRVAATMKDEDIQLRSDDDQTTYLHHIVNQVRAELLKMPAVTINLFCIRDCCYQ